ncbi:hypothetical protein XaC1_476 [Xanthomonas phage XaC1]|nr:hypothetical protein XaC1_476 [Xanthomonas phage XaC1]
MIVEVDVFEVQLVDRITKKVIKTYDAGMDYDKALQIQDQWNLAYVNGTNYTKIETYYDEIEE